MQMDTIGRDGYVADGDGEEYGSKGRGATGSAQSYVASTRAEASAKAEKQDGMKAMVSDTLARARERKQNEVKDERVEAEQVRLGAVAEASRMAASVPVLGLGMTSRGEKRDDRPTGAAPEREYVVHARGTRSSQD